MAILCAAVVGQANNPLYIEAFEATTEEEILRFHNIAHCSLDAVEKALEEDKGRKPPGELRDSYLGMLYPTESYKVYGYVSNTKIKFFLVLGDPIPKDEDLKRIFQRFHAAYVDAVSNPFFTMNMAVKSKSFDASVRTIVKAV